jgi:hypothetical protein
MLVHCAVFVLKSHSVSSPLAVKLIRSEVKHFTVVYLLR